MINLRSAREIEKMRQAGRLTAMALDRVAAAVEEGITTGELDRIADRHIRENGGKPSFLGYRRFPRSITVSINEEVVHGIPGKRRLARGDLVSIDLGVVLDGYQGDAAITVVVGGVAEPEKMRLLEVTRAALEKGIAQARVGNRLSDISHAIQEHVEDAGFAVVRDLVGHGIGQEMHEDPQIPNYGPPGYGPLLQSGMVFALEPMVNMGTYRVVIRPDGWTVVTADGMCSAHFEHTVAVTDNGPQIMTLP